MQTVATKPLHTRMIVHPSGPIHIGHIGLALLNKCAAEATGGTFIYGTRELFCRLHAGKVNWPETWAKRDLQELCEWVPPTSADELARQGFDPTWGAFYGGEVEDLEEAKRLWVDLGFEGAWGPWPPEKPPEQESWHWQAITMGQYEQGCPHPFITLVRVLVEYKTGRNLLIRGHDRAEEMDLYNAIAYRVRGPNDLIWQRFVPAIERSGEGVSEEARAHLDGDIWRQPDQAVRLSSSGPAHTAGWYVEDVKAAGRTPEELKLFVLSRMGRRNDPVMLMEGWTYHDTGPGAFQALRHLRRRIVIQEDDWADFLAHGWRGPRTEDYYSSEGVQE